MKRILAAPLLSLALLGLMGAACAPTAGPGGSTHTITQALHDAELVADFADVSGPTLLDNHTLSPDQAQAIRDSAHTVKVAVVFARGLLKTGDAAGAAAQLAAIAADVANLKTVPGAPK